MEIKPNHKYKIKKWSQRPDHWNKSGQMDRWQGKTITIKECKTITIKEFRGAYYRIRDDGGAWSWRETDFEPLYELEDSLFEI